MGRYGARFGQPPCRTVVDGFELLSRYIFNVSFSSSHSIPSMRSKNLFEAASIVRCIRNVAQSSCRSYLTLFDSMPFAVMTGPICLLRRLLLTLLRSLLARSQSDAPPVPAHHFPFLRLPFEILLHIYHYLLVKPGGSYLHAVRDPSTSKITDYQIYRHLSLALCCRQLHAETTKVFFGYPDSSSRTIPFSLRFCAT